MALVSLVLTGTGSSLVAKNREAGEKTVEKPSATSTDETMSGALSNTGLCSVFIGMA